MKRLFIAVTYAPEPWLQTLTHNLKKGMSKMDQTNWVDDHLYHITIKFLGNIREEKIPHLSRILSQCVHDTPPFSLQLDQLKAFGSTYHPRVLIITAIAHPCMIQIHKNIEEQIQKIGLKPDFGNFVPHLTLARIHALDDKKMFWNAINRYQINDTHIIPVDKITLYESILTKGYQPRYVALEEFPLK
ncbi:MAG: RNA 2',3'-cyclic phosphodiesterase [Bacteroidales bacterium]|nr:RNA 2',3'-cyclic phosphodiesterase [Bacteroidales bacterium]